jgi:hypothetical protein
MLSEQGAKGSQKSYIDFSKILFLLLYKKILKMIYVKENKKSTGCNFL